MSNLEHITKKNFKATMVHMTWFKVAPSQNHYIRRWGVNSTIRLQTYQSLTQLDDGVYMALDRMLILYNGEMFWMNRVNNMHQVIHDTFMGKFDDNLTLYNRLKILIGM